MTNGNPIAIPASPAPAAVIHTFGSDPTSGLAPLDVVAMTVQNTDNTNPATVVVTFTPATGAPVQQSYTVPAMSQRQVLDEDPFGGAQSGVGGGTISVGLASGAGLSATARAWGWFVRTRG